jgi:K+-sensing histidine kinase KdpD
MQTRPHIGKRPGWLRYGAAVGLIAVFVGIKWLLSFLIQVPPLGRDAPFLLLLVPILVSAWYGGLGPGILATALGVVAVQYFFLAPYYDLHTDPSGALHSAVYATQGFLLAAFMATVQSSRIHAETSARRMEGLYSVSAALGGARSVSEVTEVIVHEAVAVLGADGVAVWFMTEGGESLRKVMALGRSGGRFPGAPENRPVDEGPFHEIPLDAEGPVSLAARSRSVVVVEDREELHTRFPSVEQVAQGSFIPPSLICAPMVVHDRVAGVLLVAFVHTRRVSADEREWVKALAQDCGMSAQRARLLETERRARVEAEEAIHAKDEFLASVSNELRAPLTTIIGWAHLLRKEKASDRARYEHGLDVIERSAQAQARLVSDIIEMSRIAARRLKVAIEPLDLSALVHKAVDDLQVSAAASGIDLEMTTSASATVVADPSRIEQVMHYVISHAFKSTPPGGHVNVRIVSGNHKACVHVTDDGNGLSQADLQRVFESFRNGTDTSGEGSSKGLGLGMPIAKHLVEEHRGRMRVTSPGPGQGTTITVELPLAESVAGVLAINGKPHRSREGTRPLRGLRVLVVDDDPDAREVLSEMLASEGAEIRSAGSATQAIESLGDFEPNVVVCDTGLPEQGDEAFVRKMRSLPAPLARLPAVALIERAQPDNVKAAKGAGFQRQLSKPPDPRALIQAVAELGASHQTP